MSEHTPEPWKTRDVATAQWTGWQIAVDGPPPRQPVCDVPFGSFNAHDNARLIAAAPDLLAACEAYLDAMERYGHPDKTDRLMRAAITKAKGK